MSVIPADTVLYGSALMPEADGVAVGGAVDFSRRVVFYDISPAGTINFVSSAAGDTGVQVQVAGRDASGIVRTPTAITLNGTTPVIGTQSFERLLYGVVSGASPGGPLAALTGGANTTVGGGGITNVATTLPVSSAAGFPTTGTYYVAVDTGANFEIMQVTGGQGTTSWTVVRGVSGPSPAGIAHSSGAPIYLMPVGDVAAFSNTAVPGTGMSGTAQTGSANHTGTTPPLIHLATGAGGTLSGLVYGGIGLIIRITGGTGANQLRQIIASTGYGTDIVAVNRDWTAIPDTSSTYTIYQGILFPTGFASSGATYGDPNPCTSVVRCFATAAADTPQGAARYFYEKLFAVNNNTANALLSPQIELAGESPTLPSGVLIDLGLVTTLNDTGSANPRQQASNFLPTGVTSFVSQPSFINVPNGALPNGNAPNGAGSQGCWLRLTLPAGSSAYKGAIDARLQGSTT